MPQKPHIILVGEEIFCFDQAKALIAKGLNMVVFKVSVVGILLL